MLGLPFRRYPKPKCQLPVAARYTLDLQGNCIFSSLPLPKLVLSDLLPVTLNLTAHVSLNIGSAEVKVVEEKEGGDSGVPDAFSRGIETPQ